VLAPAAVMVPVVLVVTLLALAALGVLGARAGGAPVLPALGRVLVWGVFAMAITAAIGHVFGTGTRSLPGVPRRLVALLLSLCAALPAGAQPVLRTLFDVTGVAASDRLNVRGMPEASSSIRSELAPDAKGVEVVAVRSGWGLVNT